jgi:hypothetical protein
MSGVFNIKTVEKLGKMGKFKLDSLSPPALKDFVEISRMLNEPWSLELLRHAAGPNSPIDVDNLPRINQSLPMVLSRLHNFESQHLLKCHFETHGKTIRRVYRITALGRRVVSYTK